MPEASRIQASYCSSEVAKEHARRHQESCGSTFDQLLCPVDECSLATICTACREVLFLAIDLTKGSCAAAEEVLTWIHQGHRVEL